MTKVIGIRDDLYLNIMKKQTEAFEKYGKKPDLTIIASDALEIGLSVIKLEKYDEKTIKQIQHISPVV